MHRGVDFAAPSGTPIFAAGSGTIVYRSRNGSYGNYIRIRHNSEYSTAYAHLSKFNRNVTKGSRVRQGQIIGYVGTTGRSTGAHLHYEILRRGRQINPMRVKMPSGRRLKGPNLLKFQISKDQVLEILLDQSAKKKLP
jgi:murein DD-endopeptidase MepM/ murein hydrolase activator NlpD